MAPPFFKGGPGGILAALVVHLLLAGCGVTTQSPKTHFYTLSVESEPAPSRAEAAGGPAVRVAVLRAAVPGVVDRPQIVARVASNRVEIFDFHRWAEPLQEAIPRALAGNLARELGPRYAVAAPAAPGVPPDVRVSLDVQRFDAVMGGSVTVETLWSVRPAAGEPRTGRALVEERVTEDGHAGVAAAYSKALAGIAREIGKAIAAAPGPKK